MEVDLLNCARPAKARYAARLLVSAGLAPTVRPEGSGWVVSMSSGDIATAALTLNAPILHSDGTGNVFELPDDSAVFNRDLVAFMWHDHMLVAHDAEDAMALLEDSMPDLASYEASEYPAGWSGSPEERLSSVEPSNPVRIPAADMPRGLVRVMHALLPEASVTVMMAAGDWAELCGRGIVSARAWT